MEYVVQMREAGIEVPRERQPDWPPTVDMWVDAARVTVPAKTKRSTVISKAVEENPWLLKGGKAELRVIPAEHAVPIKAEMEQPPPQLKIG